MKVMVRHGLEPEAGLGLLADSSVLTGNRPLFIPDWACSLELRLGLVFRVCRLGKHVSPRFAHRYWDAATGCLLTRGVDAEGRLIAGDALTESHDGALLLGQMLPREDLAWDDGALTAHTGVGQWGAMPLRGLDKLAEDTLCRASRHMTLKTGDLLCLPGEAHSRAEAGSTAEVRRQGQTLLRCKIR